LKKITLTAVTLLIFALCIGPGLAAQALAQTAASVTSLLGPPSGDGPVVVRAAFHLQDIIEIDDETETFQFTGVLTLTWRDKRQTFDPGQVQVEEKIYQGEYQFNELSPAWYPQVVLANVSGLYEKHGTLLRVRPNGTSTLIETVNAVAKTNLDMRRYPFDTQRLEAVFEVLGFDRREVVLEAQAVPDTASSEDIRISQWEFAGLRVSSGERSAPFAGKGDTSSTFVVSMDVERKPFFMLRLVILPLVLIVMLSWSVFWMDRSSLGDRVNVSFIGILTAVAYQMLVSDFRPHIAYITLMNAILNFSFFVMCPAVVENLIVGALDKRGNIQAGDLMDYRCRRIFPLVYFGLLLVSVAVAFLFF
jgi:hypothetical protein